MDARELTEQRSANGAGEQTAAAEAWVANFAEGWRNPADADSFCDHFEPWFDLEVRMVQPQLPTQVGPRAFRERFARPLFDLVPDLHGEVEGWASKGDLIYIALRLEGTIGRRKFVMPTCDQITLRDGKAIERVAHLDPAPLLRAVALSPSSWLRFARTQRASRKKGPR